MTPDLTTEDSIMVYDNLHADDYADLHDTYLSTPCLKGEIGVTGSPGNNGVCLPSSSELTDILAAWKYYQELQSSIPKDTMDRYETAKVNIVRCDNASKALASALLTLQVYDVNIDYENILIELKKYKVLHSQYESLIKSIEIDYPHIRDFGSDYFPSRYYTNCHKNKSSLILSALTN